MNDYKYKLADDTWDEYELKAIEDVIKSRKFTMGEKVSQFERQFASYVGSKYAVMSNSGSSANLLAISALFYANKLKKGDEVIVPAVSWSTTYYPVHQMGLKLVYVDIDIETLNMSTKDVENAITNKTKAIFAVNLLGNPNDFDVLLEICNRHNLILIEDNCESLGATYKEKQCGTFGLLGTYSSFYSHHISTMEGGVTVTDDKNLYDLMLSLRAHGWTRNLDDKSTIYTKKENKFYESFNFILPGYNLRPLEFEGSIGIEQIKKIPKIIQQRRKNAEYFIGRIKNYNDLIHQKELGDSSWFGFSIILRGNLQNKRDELVNYLNSVGIEVRPIVAGNFTLNRVNKLLNNRIYGKLESATFLHHNGFFIGNHSKSNHKEVDYFFNQLDKFLSNSE